MKYENDSYHSQMDTSIKVECTLDCNESFPEDLQNGEPVKVKRPKGRPRGAKTGTGRRSTNKIRVPASVFQSVVSDKLPKMKPNIHNICIMPEQVENLKKMSDFFQPGVCFKIAPDLDKCKECKKYYSKRIIRQTKRGEVDCRFYQFRKLRYNGDELEVSGFSNPDTDPVEVDRNIWLPNADKLRHKTLSPQNARLILTHVGDELCQLIETEKIYYQKYNSDKPIIWKRLIEGVLEICDLCSTTLFNYHFICTRCGFSLCIDCVNESANGEFTISCSSKERDVHSLSDLSLTQIIVGNCMENLQSAFHDACYLWKIDHHCEQTKTPPVIDKAMMNLVRNLLIEMNTGNSVINREFQHKHAIIEVDLKKLELDAPDPISDIDANFDEYYNKFKKSSSDQPHCKPIRDFTSEGRESVISVSRSMSQATSNMLFPNVPHQWLCENKLLRLLEPMHPGNDAFFHEQWQRGQPVLISNILDHLQKELWIPQAFSAEFGTQMSDFINCMTGKLVRNKEISTFWDGFENVQKRLLDNEGRPMLLKLKDWPPDSDFKNIMPSRFEDIMKNLPLNAYTNRTGDLNIVKYLPYCFLIPDLGPKGYFAYGSPFHLKEGTTNLHLDVSDAVNVMCYIGFPRDDNRSIDEYINQGFAAILEADCDYANVNRVIEDGEIPGAIWHIYEASDANRIRDFLLKIAQEQGFHVAVDHDVIHDQNWYLNGELRTRLYAEYGVKGYAIVQCLGDCIILPAGTPHQVRNIYSCIKIAEDFVSPQQVGHCLHLSNEFRKLTKVRYFIAEHFLNTIFN